MARSLRELRHRGLTVEELEAARLLTLREVRAANDVPEVAAVQYGYATVRGEPCPDEMIPIVEAITMDEVVDLARAVFRAKPAFIFVAGPRDVDDQRAAWTSFESALGD